jgi:hypothetical protein
MEREQFSAGARDSPALQIRTGGILETGDPEGIRVAEGRNISSS